MRTMSTKRTKSTARMHAVRPAINARCEGECERCGTPFPVMDDGLSAFQLHHRILRSRGGSDEASSLLALCPRCHALTHQHPTESTIHGWMLRAGLDPEREALTYKGSPALLVGDTVVYL